MREIKFKLVGGNRKFNEIVISEAYTLRDLLDGSYLTFFSLSNRYSPYGNTTGNCEFIGEILYTGLHDKNGVEEVYESDLILAVYRPYLSQESTIHGEVTFYKGSFYVKDNIGKMYPFQYVEDIEIVGNIHQNQELLTNK